MKSYQNPKRDSWPSLIIRGTNYSLETKKTVKEIIDTVKIKGDAAMYEYSERFDKVKLDNLKVAKENIQNAEVDAQLEEAIDVAIGNITKFHESQIEEPRKIGTTEGVQCWRESRAVQNVGLYVPGGTAPLFSSLIMLGVPAKLAGCKNIIVCTPPNKYGTVDPAILYVAKKLEISEIFKVGGAQAVAAMSFGTESIPKVEKIFGPGNQFVTMAKQLVWEYGTSIDMPAGPSEVLIIADDTAQASFIASDLLAQAEHGPDSQVVLLSNSNSLLAEVEREIKLQIKKLPREKIAAEALDNSYFLKFNELETCVAFSNFYAPEHLIINTQENEMLTTMVQNAGSVFIGQYSCEALGDYASGTNHTLPTNGFARKYSGVSLDSFIKKITFQKISKNGIQNLGPFVEKMAQAENLMAHKNSVTIRLEKLKRDKTK